MIKVFAKITVSICLSSVLLMPGILRSQQASDVKISGLAYNAYYYNLSENSNDKNGFDLTRLYLTFKKPLSKNIGIRVTTDIGRVSNDQEKGYYRLYLKYGYIEFKKPAWKLKVLAGLHYVPLLAFQEHIWGYRSISKMLTDLEYKQTSSDLGLKLHGQLPRDFGEYVFSFVNGEGYNRPEHGKHKGFYGRLTIRPLPATIHGLRLTGFMSHIQHNQESSTEVNTGFATFESNRMTLCAELSMGNDKISDLKTNFWGYSLFGFYKVNPKWTLIGRVDWFDPDTEIDENAHRREVLGVGYWINKSVELIFDYQGTQYDKDAVDIDSNIIYAHLHFVF